MRRDAVRDKTEWIRDGSIRKTSERPMIVEDAVEPVLKVTCRPSESSKIDEPVARCPLGSQQGWENERHEQQWFETIGQFAFHGLVLRCGVTLAKRCGGVNVPALIQE